MTKILIKLFVVAFLINFSAVAEIINKITISGNKRISDESIKVLGNISGKKDFNQADLNNLLKSLYNTDFFSDVKITIDNGELKIDVIENSIIENIEFTGIKNKTFIKELSEIIVLKDRMSFSEIQ